MSMFDSPSFKPMDRVAGKASLSVTKTGVGFSKQAISKLNYPHYVQMFINKDDKLLGMRACSANDPNSIKFVNKSKDKVDSVRWNNPEFTDELNSLIEQKDFPKGYKVFAEYLLEEKALLFDFKKAVPLENND